MDNSFDKLNGEFADKSKSGPKYWIWMVFSYLFAVLGAAIGIYAVMPANNSYLSLLTLLCGLFGMQTASWSKAARGVWDKPLKIAMIACGVVLVFACVILYIVLPYVKSK